MLEATVMSRAARPAVDDCGRGIGRLLSGRLSFREASCQQVSSLARTPGPTGTLLLKGHQSSYNRPRCVLRWYERVLHSPRVLPPMRGTHLESARAPPSLQVWSATAGPLRSRRGTRLVPRDAEGSRAQHVAVPRADAALRRRGACVARR